jgi:hypothetical protein
MTTSWLVINEREESSAPPEKFIYFKVCPLQTQQIKMTQLCKTLFIIFFETGIAEYSRH